MAVRVVDCALRTLLVLSMWHAPIPWVHAHDLAGPIVDQGGTLARHVEEFHAGLDHHGEGDIGWHTHLVLPWCLSHHAPCPLDRQGDESETHYLSGLKFGVVQPAPTPVSMGHALAVAYLPVSELCALAHPHNRLSMPIGPNARNRALHFLGTYGGSVSLGDLLSVHVC